MEKNPPNEFVISRTLNAPRDKVWRAWTEREELMKWFGPKGVTIPVANMDLRPGGEFHYCMRTAEGHEMWGKWTFREIEPPKKLVLISTFSDAQGGITRHPMAADWPLQTLSTTTFEALGDNTLLTITWSPWQANEAEMKKFAESFTGMQNGWGGTFEQLTAYLTAN
jgi:uncharacterized protein YndB with AHSA1/START domain